MSHGGHAESVICKKSGSTAKATPQAAGGGGGAAGGSGGENFSQSKGVKKKAYDAGVARGKEEGFKEGYGKAVEEHEEEYYDDDDDYDDEDDDDEDDDDDDDEEEKTAATRVKRQRPRLGLHFGGGGGKNRLFH